MIAVVSVRGQAEQRYAIEKPELLIGGLHRRFRGCDIVIDDPHVSAPHARLYYRDGRVILEDLGSENGVCINGTIVNGLIAVDPDDEIEIGRSLLRFEGWESQPEPPSPLDARGVRLCAAGDRASRLVYADWLEEGGETERAAFLRLQEAIAAGGAAGVPALAELVARAVRIDLAWRVAVGTTSTVPLTFSIRCRRRIAQNWERRDTCRAPDDPDGCGDCIAQELTAIDGGTPSGFIVLGRLRAPRPG